MFLFSNEICIEVPVVTPFSIPLIIIGISDSFRDVVPFAPGRLRSISLRKSSCDMAMPEGTPSIVTPILGVWDSPQRVILNLLPKVFIL